MIKKTKWTLPFLALVVLGLGVASSLQAYSPSNATASVDTGGSSNGGSDSGGNSGSGGSGGSSGSDGSGLVFDAEHPRTITCDDTSWERWDFYNSSGSLVGTTLIQKGVITVQYNGSYSYVVYSKGGVQSHEATMMECYGWGWGCTSKTAVQACA